MKFLRTVRFDETDGRVYDRAAMAGEWAVSGAFAFAAADPAAVTGKLKQAFANGFLGLGSFGRSTFATVGEITEAELGAVRDVLAGHFVAQYGAPDPAAALPVAEVEIEFVRDLVEKVTINTVFTVLRRFDAEGEIREEFRIIEAPRGVEQHGRAWTIDSDDA